MLGTYILTDKTCLGNTCIIFAHPRKGIALLCVGKFNGIVCLLGHGFSDLAECRGAGRYAVRRDWSCQIYFIRGCVK